MPGIGAQVKILDSVSVGFRSTVVLDQECGFSPFLFTIYLESVLYNWNKKCRRMGLPTGSQTIHHHLFADDLVIIVQVKGDAEYNTKINRRISEMGLICNYSLNRVFKCRKDIQNIKLEHNIASKSSRPFKYLVPTLTYSRKCNEEVFNKTEQFHCFLPVQYFELFIYIPTTHTHTQNGIAITRQDRTQHTHYNRHAATSIK